jgi:site-specific recombinase XerC
MTTEITVYQADNPLARFITGANKDRDCRLRRFIDWQTQAGQDWHNPNLAAWRDDLLAQGLAPSTVAAYMATVRGRYGEIGKDNAIRQQIFDSTPERLSPADRFAMVNEVITRMQNAVDPKQAPVKVLIKQDRADSEHTRLSGRQAANLLKAPGTSTLKGLRDTAMLAVMLCTGIREGELVALNVSDLRQRLDGELALLVRHGKGNKQRLIPYGEYDFCLALVDLYLHRAGITEGVVFRGMVKGDKIRTDGKPLTTRSVQKILARYPVMIDGQVKAIKPHDCRRTYARLQYDSGATLESIQENLGHSSVETTRLYIGRLDAKARRGRAAFTFDLSGLDNRQPA